MPKLTVNCKQLSIFGAALVATILLYGCGGADLQGSETDADPHAVADQNSPESPVVLEAAASDLSKSTNKRSLSMKGPNQYTTFSCTESCNLEIKYASNGLIELTGSCDNGRGRMRWNHWGPGYCNGDLANCGGSIVCTTRGC